MTARPHPFNQNNTTMEYRVNIPQQPGCGGCLPWIIGLLLLVSFFPSFGSALLRVLLSLPLILFAAFFAFSWYVQRKVAAYEASQTEAHRRFVMLLVKILVKIAEADGHFTKAELKTMLNFFQYNLRYNQERMYWVKQLIKDARDSPASLDELLAEFRQGFNYESRLILQDLIFQVVYTREPPDAGQLDLARKIARILEISSYDLRAIEARYRYGRHRQQQDAGRQWQQQWEQQWRRQSGGYGGFGGQQGGYGQGGGASWGERPGLEEHYYEVLGLEKGAGFEAIKKSYRKLCLQYHPDKVAHLGEEFKRVAEEKMKEINVAYDYFEKKFK